MDGVVGVELRANGGMVETIGPTSTLQVQAGTSAVPATAPNLVPSPVTARAEHRPLLSLIVPAYNEGEGLASSLTEMAQYLAGAGIDHEIIVVDDGSTDGTADLLARLGGEQPRLRGVGYRLNRGKGHAIRTGVEEARGQYVMFTDADLSIPIGITAKFLQALRGGYDIAIASRWHPASTNAVPPPLSRRVMGVIFRWFVRRLVISDVRDTQCGSKAYRAEVARNLFAQQRIDRFSFDAEVIFLAARAGYRIKEIPFALRHTPSSSIRPLRDSLLMLRDLGRIRLNAARGCYRGLAPGEDDRHARDEAVMEM